MLRRSLAHMRHNLVAYLALFVALGGTAYAANTVRTGDIVDNEVFTTDVRDDTLGFGGLFHQDLAAGSVRSSEVLDSSIRAVDIQDSSITGTDIGNSTLTGDNILFGSIQSDDIRSGTLTGFNIGDNSLTGSDINESTLTLPPTTTATLAGRGNVPVGNGFNKIVGKTLPAGSYAITATANIVGVTANDINRQTWCELRNPSGAFIGGARDARVAPNPAATITVSLSMNGVVQVPAGGGEVGLWCRYQATNANDSELVGDGQMMIVRLDGFF